VVYHIEYNTVVQRMGAPNAGVKMHTVDLEPQIIKALARKGAISLWRQ
jgi:hypothetical protein